MRKWQILLGGAALGLMVMTGCTARMTQADRDLLNQALESGQMAAQEAQKARRRREWPVMRRLVPRQRQSVPMLLLLLPRRVPPWLPTAP